MRNLCRSFALLLVTVFGFSFSVSSLEAWPSAPEGVLQRMAGAIPSCDLVEAAAAAVSEAAAAGQVCFAIAAEADRNALVGLAVASNDTYHTRSVPEAVARDVFAISTEQVAQGGVEVLKEAAGGEVLGFYTLKKDDAGADAANRVELGHLFVRPGLQRQGLGSVLFGRALQKARALGAKTMHWISDPDAAGFYLKKGASVTGSDENLLNPGVPVPLFSIAL